MTNFYCLHIFSTVFTYNEFLKECYELTIDVNIPYLDHLIWFIRRFLLSSASTNFHILQLLIQRCAFDLSIICQLFCELQIYDDGVTNFVEDRFIYLKQGHLLFKFCHLRCPFISNSLINQPFSKSDQSVLR